MSRQLNTVIVSTTNGTDIMGILREQTDDAMVLSSAKVAGDVQGKPVWQSLAGEVVIPMSRVDYWQRKIPVELLDSLAVTEG